MERKQSIITAGILSGALLVGSAAYALTGGFLAGGPDDGAGTLAPVIAPAVATSVLPSTAPAATGSPSITTAPAPAAGQVVSDDDHVDDGSHQEHEGDDRRAHDVYEGRDDDD